MKHVHVAWWMWVLAACSNPTPPKGRLVVVLTLDWEGAYLSTEGLDAIEAMRAGMTDVPVTHFVSAGYFTKTPQTPDAGGALKAAVKPGDEVAMHLHTWASLARASGLEPKASPSFLTGTDKVLQFPDGDVGFDTDLDTYDVPELRSMLQTSRQLIEANGLDISTSFRAGGYLATPKVLAAIAAEGYTADASAIDAKLLSAETPDLASRLRMLWPTIGSTTQPLVLPIVGEHHLVELPITSVLDYVSVDDTLALVDKIAAQRHAHPEGDAFVVLAFHQETAEEFVPRVREVITRARGRYGDEITFTTVEKAVEAR